MTKCDPNCDCDHVFVDDLNAVLRAFVERREVEQANASTLRDNHAREQWRDTVGGET